MQLTRSEAHKFGGSRRTDCVFVFRDITHTYTFDGGEFHIPGFLHDGLMYSPPDSAITESIYANGEVSVRELHVLPTNDAEKSHAVSEVALSVYRREPGDKDTRFGVSVAIPASLKFISADEFHEERWWLALALPPEQYEKFRELLIAGQLSEVRTTAEVSGYSAYYERDPHYVETNEHGAAECAVTKFECWRTTGDGAHRTEQSDTHVQSLVAKLNAVSKQMDASLVTQKYIAIALWLLLAVSIFMVLR